MNTLPVQDLIDRLLEQAQAERTGQVEWLKDLLEMLDAGELGSVRDTITAAIKVCGKTSQRAGPAEPRGRVQGQDRLSL